MLKSLLKTTALVLFLTTSLLILLATKAEEKEEVVVAACPTFYYLLEKIEDKEHVVAIKTNSTAETVSLLQEEKIDFGIGGRPLTEKEEKIKHLVIGKGYDFIATQGFTLPEQEMAYFTFYTNLEKEEILRDFQYIKEENLVKINNIHDYLNKGVAITKIEERMPQGAESVHIVKENGQRVRLSRKPRVFFLPETDIERFLLLEGVVEE